MQTYAGNAGVYSMLHRRASHENYGFAYFTVVGSPTQMFHTIFQELKSSSRGNLSDEELLLVHLPLLLKSSVWHIESNAAYTWATLVLVEM